MYELTEIVRQGEGNPIIHISNNLEEVVNFQENLNSLGEGYLFTTNLENVVKNLAAGKGGSKIKFLAWTNKVVDKMNKQVRELIYGPYPEKLYVGETIIANGSTGSIKNNSEILIENKKEYVEYLKVCTTKQFDEIRQEPRFKKIKVEINEVPVSEGFVITNGSLYIKVKSDSINNGKAKILHEKSEVVFNQAVRILKALASKRLFPWNSVFAFEEKFIKFKYGYALSIHKAQGSTFENVIIDLKNIRNNRNEYNQMLYTGITRASKKVIFFYDVDAVEEEE